MRTQRKFLAILIALCLMISMMPIAVFADGEQDYSSDGAITIAKNEYQQSENTNFWYVGADSSKDAVYAYLTADEGADSTYTLVVVGSGEVQANSYSNWSNYTSQITSIEIKEGITSLGINISRETTGVSISIPSSVSSIVVTEGGGHAFGNTADIASITVDSDNQSYKMVDGVLFTVDGSTLIRYTADAAEDYEIPEGTTTIAAKAFSQVSTLTGVTMPDTLSTIGIEAFAGASALQSVTIPASVSSIGNNAFNNCTALESAVLECTVLSGSMFQNCSNLKSVTLAEGTTTIPDRAFLNCTSLSSVEIPGTVTQIGSSGNNGPFSGSGLESVVVNADEDITISATSFANIKTDDLHVIIGSENGTVTLKDNFTNTTGVTSAKFYGEVKFESSLFVGSGTSNSPWKILDLSEVTGLTISVENSFLWYLNNDGIVYVPTSEMQSTISAVAGSGKNPVYAITGGGTFENAPTSNTELAIPSQIGSIFGGWYTDAGFDPDSKVTDNAISKGENGKYPTYYAKWTECTEHVPNADDGDCTTEVICSLCGAVTTPAQESHTWGDWVVTTPATYDNTGVETRTCTNEGCKATETRTIPKLTYTSNNSGSSSSSSTYAVSVDTAKNGTVSVSPKNASKGTTVTITAKPNDGYEVDEVIVTDKNGDTVKVTAKGNDKYTFVMPAGKVDVEVTFVKEYVAPAISFTDVKSGAWYYDAALYAAENGLMSGTGNGAFSPDLTTSRAMIWTILARVDGQNISVTYGNWYDKAQAWAISAGVSDGTNPDNPITREQLAVMLYGFAKEQGYTTANGVSLSRYVDASDVSSWAVEALEWAVGNGLISSMGNNILAPTGTATRAQVAVILMNFCENIAK